MKSIFLLLLGIFGLMAGSASALDAVSVVAPMDGTLIHIEAKNGQYLYSGDQIVTIKRSDGEKVVLRSGVSGKILGLDLKLYDDVKKGQLLAKIEARLIVADQPETSKIEELPSILGLLTSLFKTTGIAELVRGQSLDWTEGAGRLLMIAVGCLLLFLGISKQFEPLLLIPIGAGAILANIAGAGMGDTGGMLYYISEIGINTGIFPLLIFMGVGALTDFGPMIANPKTALLGGAAQLGIFTTLLGALALNVVPGIDFSIKDAGAIGIIGGADGPTAIFLASQLSPRLLGSIAVAAYSYMALVPIIQPPIMRLLTTEKERTIVMSQMRYVSRREKILFPLMVIGLCAMFLPSATPLIGMLMLGNLLKESCVVERLSSTIQNSLINTVTIFLGLGVGSKLSAGKFLNIETLGILALGMVAFSIGTASGVLMAKVMNRFSKTPINPLIGAAGVSAVPMAARVVNKVGLEYNSQNFLLMHAMGPNVSGVVGSAVAAGVLLAVL